MLVHHRIRAFVIVGVVLSMGCGAAGRAIAQAMPDAAACDAAGTEAERRYELPAGLLRAIGRVESGRRDPATGQVAPWPWTINAEGRGKLFDTQAEALAATRALRQSGVGSIDVGCFQVNLVHHPLAFPTLEDGFDPRSNADYAARFLLSLKSQAGAWEPAVANYHSAMPERGLPYRDRVLASWSKDGLAVPLPPAPVAVPLVVRAITWSPASGTPGAGGMRVWTPSAPGQGAAVIRMSRG
jgi:hypothetical protein